MTRARTQFAAIAERLSPSMPIPPELAGFIDLVVPSKRPDRDLLHIEWSDATDLLNVDKGVLADFVPFIALGDGGVIAFWKDGDAQRVVHHDSEGGHDVIALDFADFLARLAHPSPKLLEQLDLSGPLDVLALLPGGRLPSTEPKAIPDATQRALATYLEQHSLSAKPTQSAEGEELRLELVSTASRMVADGLSRTATPDDYFWTMDFRSAQVGDDWQATYLDYGEWLPVPPSYCLIALIPKLLPLMKTRLPQYELSIFKDGEVFGDKGNELNLEPPADL